MSNAGDLKKLAAAAVEHLGAETTTSTLLSFISRTLALPLGGRASYAVAVALARAGFVGGLLDARGAARISLHATPAASASDAAMAADASGGDDDAAAVNGVQNVSVPASTKKRVVSLSALSLLNVAFFLFQVFYYRYRKPHLVLALSDAYEVAGASGMNILLNTILLLLPESLYARTWLCRRARTSTVACWLYTEFCTQFWHAIAAAWFVLFCAVHAVAQLVLHWHLAFSAQQPEAIDASTRGGSRWQSPHSLNWQESPILARAQRYIEPGESRQATYARLIFGSVEGLTGILLSVVITGIVLSAWRAPYRAHRGVAWLYLAVVCVHEFGVLFRPFPVSGLILVLAGGFVYAADAFYRHALAKRYAVLASARRDTHSVRVLDVATRQRAAGLFFTKVYVDGHALSVVHADGRTLRVAVRSLGDWSRRVVRAPPPTVRVAGPFSSEASAFVMADTSTPRWQRLVVAGTGVGWCGVMEFVDALLARWRRGARPAQRSIDLVWVVRDIEDVFGVAEEQLMCVEEAANEAGDADRVRIHLCFSDVAQRAAPPPVLAAWSQRVVAEPAAAADAPPPPQPLSLTKKGAFSTIMSARQRSARVRAVELQTTTTTTTTTTTVAGKKKRRSKKSSDASTAAAGDGLTQMPSWARALRDAFVVRRAAAAAAAYTPVIRWRYGRESFFRSVLADVDGGADGVIFCGAAAAAAAVRRDAALAGADFVAAW